MAALSLIADMDAALKQAGTDVVLTRGAKLNVELKARAAVRSFRGSEITSGVMSGDERLVLSPTGLDDEAWMKGYEQTTGDQGVDRHGLDCRLPKRGDGVFFNGRRRSVVHVMPILIDNTLVRIEMQVR